MAGYIFSGKDLVAERRMAIEQCAKIAEAVAVEAGDSEGEIYIARKIADKIRALLIERNTIARDLANWEI